MKKTINIKRMQRIRKKLKFVNKNRFRLSIYRSSKNISAQIIDDKHHKTLVSASSNENTKTNTIKKVPKVSFDKLLFNVLYEFKVLAIYRLSSLDINLIADLKILISKKKFIK